MKETGLGTGKMSRSELSEVIVEQVALLNEKLQEQSDHCSAKNIEGAQMVAMLCRAVNSRVTQETGKATGKATEIFETNQKEVLTRLQINGGLLGNLLAHAAEINQGHQRTSRQLDALINHAAVISQTMNRLLLRLETIGGKDKPKRSVASVVNRKRTK